MIKKMKKLLNDKKWLKEKYKKLIDEIDDWETFKKFECCTFFKSYEKVEYNLEIYEKGIRKTRNRLNFIKSFLLKYKLVDVKFEDIKEFSK